MVASIDDLLNHIDDDMRKEYLVKKLNTREGMMAICQTIISRANLTDMSEKKILEDCKSFIKSVFAKKCSSEIADEYASMICTLIKRELPIQKTFAVLE